MVIYKYLFFKLYKWAYGLAHDNTPEYTSLFTISGLLLLNIATILNIVRFIGYDLLGHFSQEFWIVLALVLASSNYVLIFRYFGVDAIIQEFDNELKNERSKGSGWVGGYIRATIILYLSSIGI
jgi:hypothetical protein